MSTYKRLQRLNLLSFLTNENALKKKLEQLCKEADSEDEKQQKLLEKCKKSKRSK